MASQQSLESPRKSIFGAITDIGNVLKGKVSDFLSGGADDDDAPPIVDEDLEEQTSEVNTIRGEGYQLSWMLHKDPRANSRSWFFTTPLGDPFPSYHTNPMPHFPARWTLIEGAKDPCESLTAPRIRLAPRELLHVHTTLERLTEAASEEKPRTCPRVLNLAHQSLGDPYQFSVLVAFLDLNKNVEVLNLIDNQLEAITALRMPCVRKLYLSDNSFASFLAIPALPECEELYLTNNFITSFAGLSAEKYPKLRKLSLFGNPIDSQPRYRHTVAELLPTLEVVDKVDLRRLMAKSVESD